MDMAQLAARAVARQVFSPGKSTVSASTEAPHGPPDDRPLPERTADELADGEAYINTASPELNEQEQFPHLFAWLKAHKKKKSTSAKRQQQQQHNQQQCSRPASASSLTSHHNNISHINSRPGSAGSWAQNSKAYSTPAAGAAGRVRQVDRTCSLSAAQACKNSSNGHPARRAQSANPANRSLHSAQEQLQQQLFRPEGSPLLHNKQPSRLQQAGGGRMPSRPQSAASSTLAGRLHTGSWLGGDRKTAHQGISQPLPAWLQVPQMTETASEATNQQQQQQQSPVPETHTMANPWSGFGFSEAPPAWLHLDMRDTSQSLSALSARPESPGAASSCIASIQRQQEHQLQHAATQLFQQLPLSGRANMPRQGLQLLAQGLALELAPAGAPAVLQLPAYAAGAQEAAGWSAHEQVSRELQVWDKLLAELCRQVQVECSQRGALLLSAVTRQRQLLHITLCACDNLHSAVLEAAVAAEQQQSRVDELQEVLEQSQQHNAKLTAGMAAKQQELDHMTSEMELQKERLRKGRFHLISQEVEVAKFEMERRMAEQLQHVKAQWTEQEAATRQQWQQEMLQALATVAGQDVAEKTKAVELVSSDTSSTGSSHGMCE